MTRHTLSTRLRGEEYTRLTAYADEHGLSLNEALHKLIHDHIGPTARRCEYATRTDDPTTCTTPITDLIIYTSSRGRVLSQDTVCPTHRGDALARPVRRGSGVTATIKPIPQE